MILDIVEAPDEALSICSEEVSVIDASLRKLLDDMIQTMYKSNGIGLAAVQVGQHKRMFVMDLQKDLYCDDYSMIDNSKTDYIAYGGPFFIINPKIVELSEEKVLMSEGCLSVPGQNSAVLRPRFVTVEFLDRHGERQVLRAQGWLARCIQHENDHLNGVLYINHLSLLKRSMIIKKLESLRKGKTNK